MYFHRSFLHAAAMLAGACSLATTAIADSFELPQNEHNFRRIATVPNYLNNDELAAETVSEIVSVTQNGNILVYTDGELDSIGFVRIGNPYWPVPDGKVDVGGEPTSVSVLGNRLALVGVNTSESFTDPSGELVVVNINTRQVIARMDLGGQPDSLAISPNSKYAAIVLENERDEDITIDGVEGGLPQPPPGELIVFDINGGDPNDWGMRRVDLTGLSEYAPDDPEPEFIDINGGNEAVISLQENNAMVLVDLETGEISGNFEMGGVSLDQIDATEDDNIVLAESLADVVREPDAVTWICDNNPDWNNAGRYCLIGSANEGDLFGGSRGFSIFERDGAVWYDSGNTFEHAAVRFGHYPEGRSENKGSEPESIEYAQFGDTKFLFVGSERGSFIAVYELTFEGPVFRQVLPGPLGPEGMLAIPSRGLLVVSGEVDDPEFGVRSSMMIYRLTDNPPSYPSLLSDNDENGTPIPWSAMSGMVGVPGSNREMLAVWDSFYSTSKIFTIDAGQVPAKVTGSIEISGGSGDYDPEGIAVAPDGSYWVASEGNASGSRLNRLLHTDASGAVIEEIFLPEEIEACRAASENRGSLGAGFEGVAVQTNNRGYRLLVAQQRGWDYTTAECEELDDDPLGLNEGEPTQTRIWTYEPMTGEWGSISYELAPLPENAAWVGLSEIIKSPNGGFVLIERDNRTGDFTELKTLVQLRWTTLTDGMVTADEKRIYDLLGDMLATNGWISDKPEGVAVLENGNTYVITDNDGVDDWSGETLFMRLGKVWKLFQGQ